MPPSRHQRGQKPSPRFVHRGMVMPDRYEFSGGAETLSAASKIRARNQRGSGAEDTALIKDRISRPGEIQSKNAAEMPRLFMLSWTSAEARRRMSSTSF